MVNACVFNDKIIDLASASVKITDLALLRGYGVFDFFRMEGFTPLFMDDHLERFFNSARALRLEFPVAKDDLKHLILKMLRKNKIAHSGVRIVLTGGESPNGYSIGSPTLFAINEPISGPPQEHFRDGIKVVSHAYQRDLPEVKTINYIVGIHRLPEVQKAGAVDTLYHYGGNILELTRSNFFIVDKSDKIITAGTNVLKGINRKKIIGWASSEFSVEERDVTMEELQSAREAFITGTTKKITPVILVDDWKIGDGKPGPVTRRLQDLYDAKVKEYCGQAQPVVK